MHTIFRILNRWTKIPLPIFAILLAIVHVICTQWLNNHSFFVMLWSCLGAKLCFDYVTIDFRNWVSNLQQDTIKGFDDTVQKATQSIATHVVKATEEVANGLTNAGASLSTGVTFRGIAKEIQSHRVGLALCAKSVLDCKSLTSVMEEAGKVTSLLGLENSIVHSALGRVCTLSGEALQQVTRTPVLQQNGYEEFEKFVPLIASAASFSGVELGGFETRHMDAFARNLRSADTITKHTRDLLEGLGIVKNKNWAILEELNAAVLELKEDHLWIATTLATRGSEFCKPENYKRVENYQTRVTALSNRLRSINLTEIKNNQICVEVNQIQSKMIDYLSQIKNIRGSMGIRPVPVGVCIKGPSQIGKTTIVAEIVRRVKIKLQERRDLFEDSRSWTQWDMNQRDEFDSGYCGQEIMYVDDAFQSKSNIDHNMWFSYISSACVGTNQGAVEQKGLLFRALLCITTCNAYPTTSIEARDIGALHQRFPLTYEVSLKPGHQVAQEWDPDFKYLDIKYGSMTGFVSQIPDRRNQRGQNVQSTQVEFPSTNLQGIVDQICEKLINNREFFERRMATMTSPVHHGDDEDLDRDSPLAPHSELPSYALNDIPEDDESTLSDDSLSDRDEIVQDIEYILSAGDATRLAYVPVEGTANSLMEVDTALRNIANDLHSALRRSHCDTIEDVGEWSLYLRRRNESGLLSSKFSPEMFRREDGLFEFLTSLGSWHVPVSFDAEFKRAFAQQRVLKVQDQYGTEYLWGPVLKQGTCLYLISPDLIQKLECVIADSLVGDIKLRLRQLKSALFTENGLRSLSQYAVMIASFNLPRIPLPYLFAGILRHLSSSVYPTGAGPYFVRGRYGYLSLRTAHNVAFTPIWSVARSFDYFESIAKRISQHMLNIVMSLLEFLGIPVEGLWRDIANLSTQLISEVITVGLAAILLFLFWKLLKLLFSKPKKLEQHSKDDPSKYSRQRKAGKEKRLKIRQFKQHSYDWMDGDDSEDDIEYDGLFWNVDKDTESSIYKAEVLEDLFFCYTEESGIVEEETSLTKIIVNKKRRAWCQLETKDFLVQTPKFVSAKRIQTVFDGKEKYAPRIVFELVGTREVVLDDYVEFMSKFEEYKIVDWQGDIYYRHIEGIFHIKVELVGLTTNIQGLPQGFTRNMLKNIGDIALDILGKKAKSDKDINTAFAHNGMDDALDLVHQLVEKHQVFMSYVPLTELDSVRLGKTTHGIGHLQQVIFNAHNYGVGDLVRFWRHSDKNKNYPYQVCEVTYVDHERDIGFAKILSKDQVLLRARQVGARADNMSSVVERFRSLEKHLCEDDIWQILANDQTCLCFLPTSSHITTGRMRIVGVNSYNINDKYEKYEYTEISQLNLSVTAARKGDCGGLILSCHDRYQTKILGFHAGGTPANWYASILRKADLNVLTQHGGVDLFETLIVKGTPTDLPHGEEVDFLGKYKFTTRPAGTRSLSHWNYSPFSKEFEEQLQPGPLDAFDPRIKIELPCNQDGVPTLLMLPNSIMCKKIPEMDKDLLSDIEDQMVSEMSSVIGHISRTPSEIRELIDRGLNGHRENEFCKGMELNKACGLPWNELPGCSKKSDFLQNIDGYISFRDNDPGVKLLTRVIHKIESAKVGERVISLSNSKLKDALIKLSAVEQGKTRVFHCIPVDKVICDAALFGDFKEAYSKAFIKLNHAIGVNPHSLQWRAIMERINIHPNVFDMDFSNYDKHLHAELMRTVFNIIRRVIQSNSPDEWDEARRVLAEESIETFVVDYDTVYRTRRGNKSGEYLTTVVNCIANDVLSFYTWIKTTDNRSLNTFRTNVSTITFGDDKIESVSDEFADQYNYFTSKEVMESIGHLITPGAKDGIERKFCSLEQAQFLKRGFVNFEGMVVGPLLQRSIESPFVWTQIANSEFAIWKNLVEQQFFEAVLHGREYYDSFRNKISKCIDYDLRAELSSLTAVPYESALTSYRLRYYGKDSHI